MSLSDVRTVFGIHSITLLNRSTGMPYGTAKCVGGSNFALSGEVISLNGGSSPFAWAVADGNISSELTFTLKEYPTWATEVFLGKQATTTAAAAGGSISTLTAKTGTLVATTGIASVTIKAGSEADLKFTKYIVKAVDATTVDVYAASDADFARGTDAVFQDDNLKITATPLTIVTDTAVEVPNFGLEITGGSGTIAMVADETVTFEVIPVNTGGSMEVTIGGNTDVYPEFSCILMAQNQAGTLFEIQIFRAKAIGMPFNMTEKAFSEAEITATSFYDSAKNGVFKIREVIA